MSISDLAKQLSNISQAALIQSYLCGCLGTGNNDDLYMEWVYGDATLAELADKLDMGFTEKILLKASLKHLEDEAWVKSMSMYVTAAVGVGILDKETTVGWWQGKTTDRGILASIARFENDTDEERRTVGKSARAFLDKFNEGLN